MTMLATPANMRKAEADGVKGVFSYSPVTNERYSATAADYFQIADDTPLKDETGEPMILATERCEIVPVGTVSLTSPSDVADALRDLISVSLDNDTPIQWNNGMGNVLRVTDAQPDMEPDEGKPGVWIELT